MDDSRREGEQLLHTLVMRDKAAALVSATHDVGREPQAGPGDAPHAGADGAAAPRRGVYRTASEEWRPPLPPGLPPQPPAPAALVEGAYPTGLRPPPGLDLRVAGNVSSQARPRLEAPQLSQSTPLAGNSVLYGYQHPGTTAQVGGGNSSSAATISDSDETSAMWAGGNAFLPVAVEQSVIAAAAASKPEDVGTIRMYFKEEITKAVLKRIPGMTESQAQAKWSDIRMASVPWVRGRLMEEECSRCGEEGDEYPRRQCTFLRGGSHLSRALPEWSEETRQAPYRKRTVCAKCTGGGTPQQEEVEPFLIFDVLAKSYRPPIAKELKQGLESVEEQLQQCVEQLRSKQRVCKAAQEGGFVSFSFSYLL